MAHATTRTDAEIVLGAIGALSTAEAVEVLQRIEALHDRVFDTMFDALVDIANGSKSAPWLRARAKVALERCGTMMSHEAKSRIIEPE